MELSALKNIGLTDDQVKTYMFLLENGSLTPPQLAQVSGESRTNAYMALKKLEELGLAVRAKVDKRLAYKAISPARLEQLLDQREHALAAARQQLDESMPKLLSTYYTNAQRPGIRFYEGEDAIRNVYEDHLKNCSGRVLCPHPRRY
jgi:sugar-specific transcriptional regulator TrmB